MQGNTYALQMGIQSMSEKPQLMRLNLNLSEQVRTDLNDLAKSAGCTLTEIVRFGLRLARLCYELDDDEKLGVFKDGQLTKEIVPPWGRRL
jgi:hypothetical protein